MVPLADDLRVREALAHFASTWFRDYVYKCISPVYRGESLLQWLTLNSHHGSRFYGFDTFARIPETTLSDVSSDFSPLGGISGRFLYGRGDGGRTLRYRSMKALFCRRSRYVNYGLVRSPPLSHPAFCR